MLLATPGLADWRVALAAILGIWLVAAAAAAFNCLAERHIDSLTMWLALWTLPHLWSLALYRVEDYCRAGLPTLPVTHRSRFTRVQIFLYSLMLFAATLLPLVVGMSGRLYLAGAIVLGLMFCQFAWRLSLVYSDQFARRTFQFSILYLSLLFGALLVDHYLDPFLKAALG